MSKIEKVGLVIVVVTTMQFVLLSVMIGEKQKITEKKLDKIIELLKHWV